MAQIALEVSVGATTPVRLAGELQFRSAGLYDVALELIPRTGTIRVGGYDELAADSDRGIPVSAGESHVDTVDPGALYARSSSGTVVVDVLASGAVSA